MKLANVQLINGTANGGFSEDDIIQLNEILSFAAVGETPLAKLLGERFAAAGLPASTIGMNGEGESTKQKVVDELNRLIGGDPIYTEDRFRSVKLSAHTRKLLRKHPTGAALVSLNKALLLDALPGYLRRKPGRGKYLIQKSATVSKSRATGKYLVLVTLVEPRELEGKMRSGRQKFERQTLDLANSLCAEINAKLFGKELARQLSARENTTAKKLFWEILEPNHTEWIEHLDDMVQHCVDTDFRISAEDLPTVEAAIYLYWDEHVVTLEPESQLNYRQVLGFLLPAFGHLKTNQFADVLILRFAHGKEPVKFLETSYQRGQTPEEARKRMWDIPTTSESKRPWTYQTRKRFLSLAWAFKNWMYESEDPTTQEPRNWCQRSQIKLKKQKQKNAGIQGVLPEELTKENDPDCIRNPALTIPQVQALLDVAWVAFDGLFFPFYLHALFRSTRVKETRTTGVGCLDVVEGTLGVSAAVDKTKRGREVEVFPIVIALHAAAEKAGKYTQRGLRPCADTRAVIAILAGFTSGSQKRLKSAQGQRKYLKDQLGIDLPNYDWGMPIPVNALRRTALSMHYKLFADPSRTTYWGGNSPGIFKEYYKRLVTKEEARLYWTMLPSWLTTEGKVEVELPHNHKLDDTLIRQVEAAKAAHAEKKKMERMEKARRRVREYWHKMHGKSGKGESQLRPAENSGAGDAA